MNCLTCARTDKAAVAVAICPHCSAGLCQQHVAETAARRGPGGMNLSCGHDTWNAAWKQPSQGAPQESSVASNR